MVYLLIMVIFYSYVKLQEGMSSCATQRSHWHSKHLERHSKRRRSSVGRSSLQQLNPVGTLVNPQRGPAVGLLVEMNFSRWLLLPKSCHCIPKFTCCWMMKGLKGCWFHLSIMQIQAEGWSFSGSKTCANQVRLIDSIQIFGVPSRFGWPDFNLSW